MKRSFWYRNSLSIVLLLLFVVALAGQVMTGWLTYNEHYVDLGAPPVSVIEYLGSGHFIEVTFENWESEFLQLGIYVILTVFLRQQGSSESKPLEGIEDVDKEPIPHDDAPWPVKKGGIWLKLYANSLSLAFMILFLISFTFHAYGSFRDHNKEQRLKHKPTVYFTEYMEQSRVWFESFQNWQSEFVSVGSIVILSIFLRQKGSPESKPVDAPDSKTGK